MSGVRRSMGTPLQAGGSTGRAAPPPWPWGHSDIPYGAGNNSTRRGSRSSARAPNGCEESFAQLGKNDLGRDPRGCGEQPAASPASRWTWGTPPRMRGADRRRAQAQHGRGNIPARTGSRSTAAPSAAPSGDHPRECGEQPEYNWKSWILKGTSPRARGAVRGERGGRGWPGNIPADAGSSGHARCSGRGGWEHPCGIRGTGGRRPGPEVHAGNIPAGCGEQSPNSIIRPSQAEASPRVRGEGVVGQPAPDALGASPAGAGNRRKSPHGCRGPGVHPRGFGGPIIARLRETQGTSPQVPGNIPAGAGSSGLLRSLTSWAWEHPREREEQDPSVAAQTSALGASPRMRGAACLP